MTTQGEQILQQYMAQQQPPTSVPPLPMQQGEGAEQVVPEGQSEKDKKIKEKLVKGLQSLASACHQLSTQAHLIHFNFEGQNFISVHEYLKKAYKKHTKQFDKLSELVRSLDYMMPMCQVGLKQAYKGFDNVDSYEPGTMLFVYNKNLEEIAMASKKVIAAAQKCQAPDAENLVAEIMGQLFDTSYFIKSILRK
jgi:DNA-binding ferritin-like protein